MKARSFCWRNSTCIHTPSVTLSLVAPFRYRLVLDDCPEFAKRFVHEIALNERDVQELDVLFRTIKVSEEYITASIEERTHQNMASTLSVALSYYRLHRIVILLGLFIGSSVYIFHHLSYYS